MLICPAPATWAVRGSQASESDAYLPRAGELIGDRQIIVGLSADPYAPIARPRLSA
jgi:hypothetical protein